MLDPKLLSAFIAGGAAILASVIAVSIAYFFVIRHDKRRRKEERADIARTLLQELADRAARCAYDFHNTWAAFDHAGGTYSKMNTQRLAKFLALEPVVYPTVGSKLSLLTPEAAASIIHFYYRLHAWNRNVRERLNLGTKTHNLAKSEANNLMFRLGETLLPALTALNKLGAMVPNSDEIGRAALATYFEQRDLSEFIREQIKMAKKLGVPTGE